jgi:hypothetical protein
VTGRGRRGVRRPPLLRVWCDAPVRVRHHTCPFGFRLLGVAPVKPVEILIAAGRHVSKGTWAESRLIGVASAPKAREPNILAGIFPRASFPASRPKGFQGVSSHRGCCTAPA